LKQKFTKVAQNRFLDDILANNPGTIWPEKNGKKLKKTTSGGL
jgi:hypothetical protein